MEQDKLILQAEEGTSLSSGSLRLYALPYGCIDLYAYDPLHRRCAVGIVVDKAHRRQGHALAMLQELSIIAERDLGLHQLYADIASTNAASIRLFTKAGYAPCAHFRQWIRTDDGYADVVRLQFIFYSHETV